ncbi:Tcb3p SCDLUD_004352 [Saccharomycodes ludwigii]|uniref:Tcb3p n=1 Tax=Saccharomycodes ludwigii TaxID=36035 RepID=UPI001E870246|nr:hypothetical protein SCDLUD_004352 [Saccharomycodes ludwigii]KAH3900035.1 hypothetical protein SCDLUD_004352 [Saccharomycodes ludwigii]
MPNSGNNNTTTTKSNRNVADSNNHKQLDNSATSSSSGFERGHSTTNSAKLTKKDDIFVASAAKNPSEFPLPNNVGAINSVPLEKIHPDDCKNLVSRNINKYDTSISNPNETSNDQHIDAIASNKATTDSLTDFLNKHQNKQGSQYPWKAIAGFDANPNTASDSNGKGIGISINGDSSVIKSYVEEYFYADYYYNFALIIGTCYFSWLFAYLGFSWLSLMIVFFCTASVYRAEFRRFNRNYRDDLKRITIHEDLSGKVETTIWLNSFLSKFWIIYMPVLSQQVKDIVNPILKSVTPGFGIDALTLNEFTLGTKAPTIDSIKSYTKKGKDIVEMDWAFSFTPNDTSNMTANEIRAKVNPKIALGITIGKGVVSKTLSVLAEDINFAAKARITLNLSDNFPNIKIVSVSLLEPPLVDFALKPIGGDTLGLDIMSFLPGLKSFVKSMIDSNAGPMLYAPNKLDINVEEILAASAKDCLGIVAVTVSKVDHLTRSASPYISLTTESGSFNNVAPEIHTSTKKKVQESCSWNETKFLLVNSLEQKLLIKCLDAATDDADYTDKLLGETDFDLHELLQKDIFANKTVNLKKGTRSTGTLTYSIQWYPVVSVSDKSDQQQKEVTPSKSNTTTAGIEDYDEFDDDIDNGADVGVLKMTLHSIVNLSTSSSPYGILNPSVELYVEDELIKAFRTIKRTNEPSWEEIIEVLIPSRSSSVLRLSVFDNQFKTKTKICEYVGTTRDLLDHWKANDFMFHGSPSGDIRLSGIWKPVKIDSLGKANGKNKKLTTSTLGTVRLHIRDGVFSSSDLSGVGDIDPYVVVSLGREIKYRSHYFSENKTPVFNSLVYLPVLNGNETVTLSFYDYQSVGKDRYIGNYSFTVSQLLKKDSSTGRYVLFDGSKDIITCGIRTSDGISKKSLAHISLSFLPAIPVFSPSELQEVKETEKRIAEHEQKFKIEQAELREKLEKCPDDYEVVEVSDDDDELVKKLHRKEQMTLKQLLDFNSGSLSFEILNGKGFSPGSYINIVFDDISYPSFVSSRIGSSVSGLSQASGVQFIRDLKHSVATIRSTKKRVAKDNDDVIKEFTIDTMDLLEKCYSEPGVIRGSNGLSLEFRCVYVPCALTLPDSETIRDTGELKVHLVSAENVPSHDRNGKSDPFVVITIDGIKVFKSNIEKKTLNPTWNETTLITLPSRSRSRITVEVYDWDRTGSNDFLCSANLPAERIKAGHHQDWKLSLKPKGTIFIKTHFKPQYMIAKADIFSAKSAKYSNFVGAGVGAGVGAVTGVADAGVGAVTGVANIGVSGVTKGGRFLKNIATGRKSQEVQRPSMDVSNSKRASSEHKRMSVDRKRSTSRKVSTSSNDKSARMSHSKSSSSPAHRASMDYDPTVPNQEYAPVPGPDSPSKMQDGDATNKRAVSSASSFARTLAPNGTYAGTVTVLSAENLGSSVQIKVSLTQGGRLKTLHKTDKVKSNKDGVATFGDSVSFKASPEANLVFGVIVHHTFSKDTELGAAQINLNDPQIQQEGQIMIRLGKGQIMLKIDYGSNTPPVPKIPKEFK